MTEQEVYTALQSIVNNAQERSLNWAVNYAKVGLGLSGDNLRVQCLYVLGNMTRWRGEEAKKVRNTLKEFTKR